MDNCPDLGMFSYFEPLETELGHRKVVQNSGSRDVFGPVKGDALLCSM